MIINPKFFHYPPYISTSWKQVAAIHMSGNTLIVNLHNGELIHIPNLSALDVEKVFKAYGDYLEKESAATQVSAAHSANPSSLNALAQALFATDFAGDSPFQFSISNMEGFASALQHNQSQAHMADLPPDIIQKIASIAKIVSPTDSQELPKAEPHCNCMYCQIARAISNGVEGEPLKTTISAPVILPPEEIAAHPWVIQQKGELMYEVTDKKDALKKFNVYLGNPMGCTCGQEGCEHLIAVLKS